MSKQLEIPAPKRQTQYDRMLKILKSKKWISAREFIFTHQVTTKPSTRIGELREKGYDIEVSEKRDERGFVSYRLV